MPRTKKTVLSIQATEAEPLLRRHGHIATISPSAYVVRLTEIVRLILDMEGNETPIDNSS